MSHDEFLTNRQKSKTAKRGRFWCSTCDMARVGKIERCPVCNNVENKKKIK